MLFDLCTKDEGNPFTTKIWVVGSYTDTLLSSLLAAYSTPFLESHILKLVKRILHTYPSHFFPLSWSDSLVKKLRMLFLQGKEILKT